MLLRHSDRTEWGAQATARASASPAAVRHRSGLRTRGAVLGAFLATLLAAMLSLPPCFAQSVPQAPPAAGSVRLVVDFGAGRLRTFEPLPWRAGDTVLSAMNAARPQGLVFASTGEGAFTMLTAIADYMNEGRKGPKNWHYWVNGRYGDRSFAVWELQDRDTVTWRFSTGEGR
jgi:Domain of unknown function (DUF4430)